MTVVLKCFTCYEQPDWSRKVIAVYIISLDIHDIRSLACALFSSDITRRDISVK